MRKLSEAIDLVLPFVSKDEAKQHMAAPAVYPDCVVATDGYTLAYARYDEPGATDPRQLASSLHAPPYRVAVPTATPFLGFAELPEMISLLPSKWQVNLEIRGPGESKLHAYLPERKRAGKVIKPRVNIITGQGLGGFDELSPHRPFGVDAHYLLRAIDLIGTPSFGLSLNKPLDPIIITPGDPGKDLWAQDRFAVVMPMRL